MGYGKFRARLGIAAVGNDLHARLHAIGCEIDSHVAAVAAFIIDVSGYFVFG